MNRYGMDRSDEELEDFYDGRMTEEEMQECRLDQQDDLERQEQAGPKREPWTFWQIAVLVADVLLWWVLIAAVWKLWPR